VDTRQKAAIAVQGLVSDRVILRADDQRFRAAAVWRAVAPRRRTPSLDNCHSSSAELASRRSPIGSRRPILRSAAMRRSVFDFVRSNRRRMDLADKKPFKPACRNNARISRRGTPSTSSVAWICIDHFSDITWSGAPTETAKGTVA
jgi:hypothetical protein